VGAARFRAAVDRFLEAGIDGYDSYLRDIQRVFSEDSETEQDPSRLNHVVNSVFLEMSRRKLDGKNAELLDLAFQGARIVISELTYASAGIERFKIDDSVYRMREYFSILNSVVSIEELVSTLRTNLESFEIRRCAIALYKDEILTKRGEPFELPREAEVVLAFDEESPMDFPFQRLSFDPTVSMFPKGMPIGLDGMLVASALYHRNEQLGYIVFEPGDLSGNINETLCAQISNAIRSSLIFSAKLRVEERLHVALHDLELYNKRLSDISLTDELTGLYNRRGFLSLGQQSIDLALRMKKPGLVVFCDMDGLKKINDTYGHDAGDRAIAAMAHILRETFRSMDIVSRLGGDEFAILAVDITSVFLDTLRGRIYKSLDAYNSAGNEPFRLSTSMGVVTFPVPGPIRLDALLSEADRVLYEEKRQKKRNGA
jgi:diguanylate cyclase (GGDEF)-like protein